MIFIPCIFFLHIYKLQQPCHSTIMDNTTLIVVMLWCLLSFLLSPAHVQHQWLYIVQHNTTFPHGTYFWRADCFCMLRNVMNDSISCLLFQAYVGLVGVEVECVYVMEVTFLSSSASETLQSILQIWNVWTSLEIFPTNNVTTKFRRLSIDNTNY